MRWFKVGSDNSGEVHLYEGIALVLELGAEIYEAEPLEDIHISGNRLTCSSARTLKKMNWDERIARLFACDCAAHVLSVFENWHPKDGRPRHAIEVAREYANGHADATKLQKAWNDARNAASSTKDKEPAYTDFVAYIAGRAAADSAATDIGWGVLATNFAAAARSSSARDKKGTTTNQSIAWIDERKWQAERLMQYLDGGI
jgi:hypothetical protein